jgi:hypothetical protein
LLVQILRGLFDSAFVAVLHRAFESLNSRIKICDCLFVQEVALVGEKFPRVLDEIATLLDVARCEEKHGPLA